MNWNISNLSVNFWPFWPMDKNGDLYVATLDTLIIITPDGIV